MPVTRTARKQIDARAVGDGWRVELIQAARTERIEIVDLHGNRLGTVRINDREDGRIHYFVNSKRASYESLCSHLRNWSKIVSSQQV